MSNKLSYSYFLLFLCTNTILLAQSDAGVINLGGESVTTSITPLRQDTTIDMRQRWLGITFSDLIVSPSDQHSISPPKLPAYLPYDMLTGQDYLEDIVAFKRYLWTKAYRVKPVVKDTSNREASGLQYPLVRAKIQGARRSFPNYRFQAMPPFNNEQLDTTFYAAWQRDTAILALYQRTIATAKDNNFMAVFFPTFKYEIVYHNKAIKLRQAAYRMYVIVHRRIEDLDRDTMMFYPRTPVLNDRCLYFGGAVGEKKLCEADLLAYQRPLSSGALPSSIHRRIKNIYAQLNASWQEDIKTFEAIIASAPDTSIMSTQEKEVFGWVLGQMNLFARTYRDVQEQFAVFVNQDPAQANYLQIFQLAEYLRVLEKLTIENDEYYQAKKAVERLNEQYCSQVWELEDEFLERQK